MNERRARPNRSHAAPLMRGRNDGYWPTTSMVSAERTLLVTGGTGFVDRTAFRSTWFCLTR